MDVRLVDQRDTRMIVTLWEERVTQFRESLAASSNGRAAFVVITGLLAKKYSLGELTQHLTQIAYGHFILQIQKQNQITSPPISLAATVILSSGDGTTTYCNIDYAPLNDLKAAVLAATGHTSDTLPPPATARLMSATADATKEKTIQEILESDLPQGDEVIRVLCEATIMSISKYDDWFYNSCPNCPCRIQFDGDKLSCRLCPGPIDKYRQSYRVNVRVQDATARTTFTLFNKEVERLVGVPIEKVIAEIGQDKLGPEAPPILNNMVAKKCLFEVKITSYNTPGHDCYTIARLSETQSTPTPSVVEPGKLPENCPETSNKGATEPSKKQRLS
ncbi:hypothetical protein POM88_053777 [Heracleum sosnowskyi]|uniref:Replication factor A C-terminal domain-containing protein n=1 Tax=Heracleum sosnowskyi TaxID=360622 RepID=A0AAD8GQ37_9APIA|nr:hypothetical protein POM88_053777 [Heracleum sosnowskyi]